MKVAFPVAPEPDPEQAEAARQLFAGPVDFVKGVVAMSGLPPADRPEVCFAGRSNVGKMRKGAGGIIEEHDTMPGNQKIRLPVMSSPAGGIMNFETYARFRAAGACRLNQRV